MSMLTRLLNETVTGLSKRQNELTVAMVRYCVAKDRNFSIGASPCWLRTAAKRPLVALGRNDLMLEAVASEGSVGDIGVGVFEEEEGVELTADCNAAGVGLGEYVELEGVDGADTAWLLSMLLSVPAEISLRTLL